LQHQRDVLGVVAGQFTQRHAACRVNVGQGHILHGPACREQQAVNLLARAVLRVAHDAGQPVRLCRR
jgi:hypothetical protein